MDTTYHLPPNNFFDDTEDEENEDYLTDEANLDDWKEEREREKLIIKH